MDWLPLWNPKQIQWNTNGIIFNLQFFKIAGIIWLSKSDVHPDRPVHIYKTLCKITYHLRESGKLLSAFLVMTITAERALVVWFPLKIPTLITRKRTIIIIIMEAVLAVVLGSYISIIFSTVSFWPGSPTTCLTQIHLHNTYNIINLVIAKGMGEIFCSVMVCIFTSFIVYKLFSARAWRQEQNIAGHLSNKEANISVMLVTIAIAFVFLRLPFTVAYYINHYQDNVFRVASSIDLMRLLYTTINLSYILVIMNYSLHFFLYR